MKHQISWHRQLLNPLPVVFLTLSFACGCGSSTLAQLPVFPVEGRVVFQSAPVAGATVAFYKEGAAVPGSGVTNAQGEFRISSYAENDGALAGKHRVGQASLLSDLCEAYPETFELGFAWGGLRDEAHLDASEVSRLGYGGQRVLEYLGQARQWKLAGERDKPVAATEFRAVGRWIARSVSRPKVG